MKLLKNNVLGGFGGSVVALLHMSTELNGGQVENKPTDSEFPQRYEDFMSQYDREDIKAFALANKRNRSIKDAVNHRNQVTSYSKLHKGIKKNETLRQKFLSEVEKKQVVDVAREEEIALSVEVEEATFVHSQRETPSPYHQVEGEAFSQRRNEIFNEIKDKPWTLSHILATLQTVDPEAYEDIQAYNINHVDYNPTKTNIKNDAIVRYLEGLNNSEFAHIVGLVSAEYAQAMYSDTLDGLKSEIHDGNFGENSDQQQRDLANNVDQFSRLNQERDNAQELFYGSLEELQEHNIDKNFFVQIFDGLGRQIFDREQVDVQPGVTGAMKTSIDGRALEGGIAGWVEAVIKDVDDKNTAYYNQLRDIYLAHNEGAKEEDFVRVWDEDIIPKFEKECENMAEKITTQEVNDVYGKPKDLLVQDVLAAVFGYIVITDLKIPGFATRSFALPNKQTLVEAFLPEPYNHIETEEQVYDTLGNIQEGVFAGMTDINILQNPAQYNRPGAAGLDRAFAGQDTLALEHARQVDAINKMLEPLGASVDRDTLVIRMKGSETRQSLFNLLERVFENSAGGQLSTIRDGDVLTPEKVQAIYEATQIFENELIEDTGVDGLSFGADGNPTLSERAEKEVNADFDFDGEDVQVKNVENGVQFSVYEDRVQNQRRGPKRPNNRFRRPIARVTVTTDDTGRVHITRNLRGKSAELWNVVQNNLRESGLPDNQVIPENRSLQNYVGVDLSDINKGKLHNYLEYKELGVQLQRMMDTHHTLDQSQQQMSQEFVNPFAVAAQGFLSRFNGTLEGYENMKGLYYVPASLDEAFATCFEAGCTDEAVRDLVSVPNVDRWFKHVSSLGGNGEDPQYYYTLMQSDIAAHYGGIESSAGAFEMTESPQAVSNKLRKSGTLANMIARLSQYTGLAIDPERLLQSVSEGQVGKLTGFGDNTNLGDEVIDIAENEEGINFVYELPEEGITFLHNGKEATLTGHLNLGLVAECTNLFVKGQGLDMNYTDPQFTGAVGGIKHLRVPIGIPVGVFADGGSSGSSGGGASKESTVPSFGNSGASTGGSGLPGGVI